MSFVFCYFFTPKPVFWVPWGVILAPLGSILVAWGSPEDSKVNPLGSEVDFLWILGALRIPVGGSIWDKFEICSSFLVSKLEVGLRTFF